MQQNRCHTSGGLYIHIAYCRRKCLYCDFFSAGDRIADWQGYTNALIAEFENRINELPCPLQTIYVGGGTPSLMPLNEFSRLCNALSPYITDVEEFTIEINPDDATEENLLAWRRGGANRLSIGIQSFDNELLKLIGRLHTAQTARAAYYLARQYFDNISIDLMFGLPGQTFETWSRDVEEAIRLNPQHISAYSLMYEPGTALTALRDRGRLKETDEVLSDQMYQYLSRRLKEAGYEHYEISNFAKPRFRSRHNSSYWIQKPYLGIGPSAHSYDGKRLRKANSHDIRGYIEHWNSLSQEYLQPTEETLNDEELKDEYIMTRLRRCEGIDLADFQRRFGKAETCRIREKAENLKKEGKVVMEKNRVAVSENWLLTSDAIILELAM